MKFVSDFVDLPVPQDNFWMTRYFSTGARLAFLKYFLIFRSSVHFCEHTGFACSLRYVKKMKRTFLILEKEHRLAKEKLDFEKISDLEMGKYKLN